MSPGWLVAPAEATSKAEGERGPQLNVSVVFVLAGGVAAAADLVGEAAGGVGQDTGDVGVFLDELRRLRAAAKTGHVLPHQYLRVAVRAGADTDRRDVEQPGDL